MRVMIRNTGRAFGEEVVQCYIAPPQDTPKGVQFAKKVLTAFERVGLDAEEAREVTLAVGSRSLCYWKVIDENGRRNQGEGW